MTRSSWSCTALTMRGWRWPRLSTPMPPAKSIQRWPSSSHSSAFSARATNWAVGVAAPLATKRFLSSLSSALVKVWVMVRSWQRVGDAAGSEPAHADVLELGELLEAVARSLAAEARLLDAAERGKLGGDDALVDADHAVLEPLHDAPDTAVVPGIEVGGKAEGGVVGHGDRLLLVAEAEHRRQRAEGLLAGHRHLRSGIGDHGGGVEALAQRMGGAAAQQAPALGHGVVHVALHLVDGGLVDQRADHHARLATVTHRHRRDLRGQGLDEGVVDPLLDQEAVGADAGLTGVTVLGGDGPGHGGVEVGIVEDDKGSVAAELHGGLLDGAGTLGQQLLAHGSGAG